MTDLKSSTVVVTGGSGRIGTALRKILAPQVARIVVLDLLEPETLSENERFTSCDMTDGEAMTAALADATAVVHLAALTQDAPIEDILRVNVLGTHNVYEAARRAGIERVILGSSAHAVGMYPRDTPIGPDVPMRPDGLYGLSKCWAELTAGLYFDKYGIRSLIIRIGNAAERPVTPRNLLTWVSARDLAQLVVLGLTHPDLKVTTAYGISAGDGLWWDNSAAEALGYRPQDRILDHAAPSAFETAPFEDGPVSDFFQGGGFSAREHDGVLRRR